MKVLYITLAITLFFEVNAQQHSKQLSKLSAAKSSAAIEELREFLSIPNDTLYPEDIIKNIDWLEQAFAKRSFETRILETDRTPLFFAEKSFNPSYPTILFYMHFDGQSIDKSKWQQDDPYIAVLKEKSNNEWNKIGWNKINEKLNRDWRIFGRSASDDKGPIVMLLQAIDAMKGNKLQPNVNIKVILDGEEEKGSLHLTDAVKKYKNLLN